MSDIERPELLNALIHALEYFPAGDIETPRLVADAIAEGRVLTGGITRYRDDVRAALDQGPHLDLGFARTDPATVRTFLEDLLGYLESPQPWPTPDLRRISESECGYSSGAAPIGSIAMARSTVADLLRRPFERFDRGGEDFEQLPLRLRTGQRILLQSQPEYSGARVDVYSPDDAADVIEAFHRITGITITPAP